MPLKNLTFERHLFHTRKQERSESINSFVTDLKNIARKCEFGDLERDLIKDRIVCGIQSDAVRKILLRETGLTLEKALSICSSSELSKQQVKDLADNEDIHEVSSLRSLRIATRQMETKTAKETSFIRAVASNNRGEND